MKHRRLSTRGLLILFTCIFLGCVFFLYAFAFYLDQNGVGPEEDAVSAVFYLNGPYLYQEEFTEEFCVKIDSQQGIADLRALEKSVKNMTLKEYTSLIVWEGTFTYIKADGTKEQRTYRKSDLNKDINKFLDKYYKPPKEGGEGQ